MKIWLDLSNSPHPLFFAPIARQLDAQGHQVLVTLRDNAQTVELARKQWPEAEVIGDESPKNPMAKSWAIASRVGRLAHWARASRPDLALSHNSDAQIAAARLLGIPSVTAMDYEHHPANHLSFRLASRILLPQALPTAFVSRQGATDSKVRHYPGLKEEIYLGDFSPNPRILEDLGITLNPGQPLVVMRTPPSRAIYHRSENNCHLDILGRLSRQDRAHCVVLTRHAEQRTQINNLGLENVTVPSSAVDSRSLMYRADLVVGAGGTVTREAALLKVPTVSIFAGRPAAVDLWLERQGLLRRITSVSELPLLGQERPPAADLVNLRKRAELLVEYFVREVLAVGEGVRTGYISVSSDNVG